MKAKTCLALSICCLLVAVAFSLGTVAASKADARGGLSFSSPPWSGMFDLAPLEEQVALLVPDNLYFVLTDVVVDSVDSYVRFEILERQSSVDFLKIDDDHYLGINATSCVDHLQSGITFEPGSQVVIKANCYNQLFFLSGHFMPVVMAP